MGSRLKQNPEQTFHWFFEAVQPVASDKEPGVLFQFPEDFNDEESCQTLPRFCFPYDTQRVSDGVAVQQFTFVLTDLEGCQRFGFCRLNNRSHTCLCILSYLPWFEVFYKLLNNLADYLTEGQTNDMKVLLAALYKQPVPVTAGSVTLQMRKACLFFSEGHQLSVNSEVSYPVVHPGGQEGVPYFVAPDTRSLPSIPENRNLTELIVAVDVGNLLQLYASLLFERRILIFARKVSTLTSCVHAVSALLYPMYWQHIFIPVLPPHLLDYCCAPMPYLIGVHSSLSERVRSRGLEEVVILNVDTNTLETPFDDLKRIPSEVMARLKVCLKRQAVSPGCGVSIAFLKAQALLFGGYKDALQGHKEGEIWFCEEMFLAHESPCMRQFLENAVHLQFFEQFIDSRLDIVNKGKEPDDLFEEEILKCETAAGRSKPYKQLVGHLKKGGGALILNMRSKANIKAKVLAKSGLKKLLMHKAHNDDTLQRGGSVSHRRSQSECLQNRLPITQHFGKPRPLRPAHKSRSSGGDEKDMKNNEDAWNGAVSGPLLELDTELQKDEEELEDLLLCDAEKMDLLGEIFDTLSSRSSHDRGLLYGTRSLDLFGLDRHDYITKRGRPANPSQESLSLSICGSGSLYSCNLENTEEMSNLAEDCGWLCLDTSVPEEEETESLLAARKMGQQEHRLRDVIEKTEERNLTINSNQGEEKYHRNNFEEVRDEDKRKNNCHEKNVGSEKDPVIEMAEKPEAKALKERRLEEPNQSMDISEEQEMEKGTKGMLKDATRDVGEDLEEKVKEVSGDLNRLIKQNLRQKRTVEEPEREWEHLNPTTSPGPPALNVDPEPQIGYENRSDEAMKKEEREMTQNTSPHKVLSAVARFQCQLQSQSLQVESRTTESSETQRSYVFQSRQKGQTNPPDTSNVSENNCSEEPKEDLPPVKVSELKKRFEA